MAAAQKRKGSKSEVEVAKLLTERLGFVVKRRLGSARDGGHDIDLPGWSLEVKRAERLRLPEWWAQTLNQAGDNTIPCLVYRQSRHPWRFIVPIRIMGSAYAGQPDGMTVEMGLDEFALVCRERLT